MLKTAAGCVERTHRMNAPAQLMEADMTLQAAQVIDTTIPHRSQPSPHAHMLLARLVEHIAADSSPHTAPNKVFQRTPDAVDEIVFEADIEDAHYYLVRTRAHATNIRARQTLPNTPGPHPCARNQPVQLKPA